MTIRGRVARLLELGSAKLQQSMCCWVPLPTSVDLMFKRFLYFFTSHFNLTIILKLLEFFGRLRLVCVSRSFIFQMQTKVIYQVIWSFWQYMQVSE